LVKRADVCGDETGRRRNNINYAIQLDAINRHRRRYISVRGSHYTENGELAAVYSRSEEGQRERERDGEMGKVAAWRPVRRGKNDRALTRYKSHYGVNLLDPSPPTDFQPPGTVLGCRLWATSHANSDKVPLSPSPFLSPPILPAFSSSRSHLPSAPTHRPRCFSSILFFRCVSLSLSLSLSLSRSVCLSGFIRQAIPTRGIPGAPQPPRTRAREYLSPGHLRAD